MARVRDLLYRFRPAGTPGAASAAGVPADRGADAAAELAPLFAQLTSIEGECTDILERAQRDAAELLAHDAERARSVVASARERTDAERAMVAAQVRQRGDAEATAALAAAERQAGDRQRRTAGRMPSYVERVVSVVRSLIGDADLTTKQPTGAP